VLSRRAGVTLLELTIALVLGGVVLAVVVSIGVLQERIYRGVADALDNQEQLRHAAAVLPVDLRGASVPGGDLVAGELRDSSIELRRTVGTGVVCELTAHGIALPPSGRGRALASFLSSLDAGDTAWVYHDSAGSDRWQGYEVQAIGHSLTACPSAAPMALVPAAADGQPRLTIDLGVDTAATGLSVGAPVRFTRLARYSVYRASDRAWYLGFRDWNAVSGQFNIIQPVSGPYASWNARSPGGLRFSYKDVSGLELGPPVADPRAVALIEILASTRTARPIEFSGPTALGSDGRHADSISVVIALRNRR
jgi:hypothetical protein